MTNGGKTTLTNSLLKSLPNCCVIHQDDFFKVAAPAGDRGWLPREGDSGEQTPPGAPWANPSWEIEGLAISVTEHLLRAWHVLTAHPFPMGQMGKLRFPEGACHLGGTLYPLQLHFPICKMGSEPALDALWRVRG